MRLGALKNRMPMRTVTLDQALHFDKLRTVVPMPRGGNEMRSLIVTAVIGAIIAAAATVLAQAPTSSTVHAAPFDLQDPAVIEAGARVFSQNCTHYCHAKEGRVARAPALRGRDLPIDYLYERITKGAPPMPAYGTVLSQDDLWRVIAYLRSLASARD